MFTTCNLYVLNPIMPSLPKSACSDIVTTPSERKFNRRQCTFFEGVTGAERDGFFLCGPFASPSDGQATTAPVSLRAMAERGTSGEVGCSSTTIVILVKILTLTEQDTWDGDAPRYSKQV